MTLFVDGGSSWPHLAFRGGFTAGSKVIGQGYMGVP